MGQPGHRPLPLPFRVVHGGHDVNPGDDVAAQEHLLEEGPGRLPQGQDTPGWMTVGVLLQPGHRLHELRVLGNQFIVLVLEQQQQSRGAVYHGVVSHTVKFKFNIIEALLNNDDERLILIKDNLVAGEQLLGKR